ncbi:hypothetical protein [Cellulomonas sp.]|uniref:hypothetical protein n=1 Tax=Cellulomonas sp. TaxID=40001 RepID=UPI003BAD6CD1
MRFRLTVGLAVALLFVGSATAYAAWSDSAAVASQTRLTAGSFGVAATWTATPPDFATLYPGQYKSAIVRVTHSGDGRWQYQVGAATTGVAGLTVSYRSVTGTTTCSATALAAATWSAAQAPATSAYFCVVAELAPTAASGIQGSSVPVTITITAQNQPTS